MKLESSLPEHPGWLFVVPGFDFMALLLALVMLTGVVAKEGLVEVKLPPSQFRALRLSDENPIIVTVQDTVDGLAYYVGRRKVAREELEEEISVAAEFRATRAVAIEADQRVSVRDQQDLMNLVTSLNLEIYLVVREEQAKLEEKE